MVSRERREEQDREVQGRSCGGRVNRLLLCIDGKEDFSKGRREKSVVVVVVLLEEEGQLCRGWQTSRDLSRGEGRRAGVVERHSKEEKFGGEVGERLRQS